MFLVLPILVIGLALLIVIISGVKMVPQAHNWVVETFGKFSKTLKPGLNFINPVFSRIAFKVDIRERVLELPPQGIITSDNASIKVDAIVFFIIMDAYKSSYGIANLEQAMTNLGITTLRNLMGKMTLDESLFSRDKINIELLKIMDEATDSWGTKITRVEIKDIQPPDELSRAMGLQKKAEQERRARVLEAEGKKEAATREAEGVKNAQILQAEARKEAAMRDAEARERLAQAEANAIGVVSASLKASGGDPLTYLLGQEYIKGLTKLGDSANAKFIVLPADLLETVKNLFKKS